MKKLLFILVFISFLTLSGCSFDRGPSDYEVFKMKERCSILVEENKDSMCTSMELRICTIDQWKYSKKSNTCIALYSMSYLSNSEGEGGNTVIKGIFDSIKKRHIEYKVCDYSDNAYCNFHEILERYDDF